MSKKLANNEASETSTTARTFRPATGMEGAGIEFIRPSKLTGPATLVEGVYVGATPNTYDNNKSDYKFEQEDGKAIVINGAGNLKYQMEKVTPGSFVQVQYLGKSKIKKGKMAGKESHNFQVNIAD